MTAYFQLRVGDDTFDWSVTRGDESPKTAALFQYEVREHRPGRDTLVYYVEHQLGEGVQRLIAKVMEESRKR